MKTELEIAKECIKNRYVNTAHKATCERQLFKDEKNLSLIEAECIEDCCDYKKKGKGSMCYICILEMKLEEEIKDKKATIKLYKENGI